jgi:hypothetical protein
MDVKVVILPANLHTYLLHVVQSYTRAGIDPNECQLAAELWVRITGAQTVDYSKLGPVDAELTKDGIALNIDPTSLAVPPDPSGTQ